MAVPMETTTPAAISIESPSKLLSKTDQVKVSSLLTVCLLTDIPVIKAVIEKSVSVWGTVKHESLPAKWTLNAVEFTVRNAAKAGRILAWPFSIPIGIADRVLSERIIEAERRWPILKESPNKVVEVAVEAVLGRANSCCTAAAALAADGKRAVAAAADLTRKMAGAARQALANFEDLVDDMAARADGESRVVEGQSSGSSEASGPPPTRRQGVGFVRRALESGVHLYVGAAVWTLSAAPLVGRFARTLRQRGAQRESSRGSPTSGRSAPSSRDSSRPETADGRD